MIKTRIEDKYFLDCIQYEYLKKIISFIFQDDLNAPDTYWVHSEYFDTKDLDFYHQKIDGEFDHFKIRNRWYDKTSPFFEIKYKKGIDQLKKKITKEEISSLSLLWNYKSLCKKIKISYQRKAFELYYNNERVRITFDQNLNFNEFPFHFHNKILMEVKYCRKIPTFLNNEFKKMGLKKVPFSKYTTAISYLTGKP